MRIVVKRTVPLLALLAITIIGICLPGCNANDDSGTLTKQIDAVSESIRVDYSRLKSISSIIHKSAMEDNDKWRRILSSCDDTECLHEKLIQKKDEIEWWIDLIDPNISLYMTGDFSKFIRASDRYFQVNDGGEIYDRATGLVWKRCLEGSYWNGSACERGVSGAYRPGQFGNSGNTGSWRLPRIFELTTLISPSTSKPAINQNVFPDQTSGHTWSATPYAGSLKEDGWMVDFSNGSTWWHSLKLTGAIRLVREPGLVELARLANVRMPLSQIIPEQKLGFSCEAVLNKVEHMICADAKLAQYDIVTEDLYGLLKGVPVINGQKLLRNHELWTAIRNACDNSVCIEKRYLERITQLRRLANLFIDRTKTPTIQSISTLMHQKVRYILDNDIVKDTATGITWKRCVEGMQWDGSTCVGAPVLYTHKEAIEEFSERGLNWRLPSNIELASIISFERIKPAMNPEVFPALQHENILDAVSKKIGTKFESGSKRFQYTLTNTSVLDMELGYTSPTPTGYIGLVRLVRNLH